VAALVVLLLVVSSVTFVLREGQVAVVTRFGAPRAVVTQAGPHLKLPWPVERVHALDGRRRVYAPRFAETLTRDKKNVILRTFVLWSVGEPLVFLQSTGDPRTAEERLDGLVTNAQNAVLGRHDLSALVSTDPARLQLAQVEERILQDVQATALQQFGVRVHQVGLQRLGFPAANTPYVFDQMRAERAQHAARQRAEGEREASAIRAQTDLEVAQITAEAKQKAAAIRGQAEAEAAQIYAEVHRRDPEFYKFLRSLDSLKSLLGRRSTVVLRTDAPPFNLLDGSGGGTGSPAGAAGRR
jgi:membrane protease subunit HflC